MALIKNENWVLVWATEINTDAKGKIDTAAVMETWRINKTARLTCCINMTDVQEKNDHSR
jgi:hypothetical protein